MSNKISIKVVVAGRTYPLTVSQGEEERIYKAADDINKSIKLLKESYAVKDMQDLLAMTALQLSAKSNTVKTTEGTVPSSNQSKEELEEIGRELQTLLEQIEQA